MFPIRAIGSPLPLSAISVPLQPPLLESPYRVTAPRRSAEVQQRSDNENMHRQRNDPTMLSAHVECVIVAHAYISEQTMPSCIMVLDVWVKRGQVDCFKVCPI